MSKALDRPGDSERFLKTDSSATDCPTLHFTSGSLAGQTVRLESGTITLGRGTKNDLRVDDLGVSRSHCKLVIEGTRVQLVDLASTNGTYVEGCRIQRTTLQDGQQILVGTGVFMHYSEPAPVQAPAPPPVPVRVPVQAPAPPPAPPPAPVRVQVPAEAKPDRPVLRLEIQNPLTGVTDRDDWLKQASQQVLSTLSKGQPVSLAMSHLDDFKKICDTHGHAAGDAVLEEFCQRVLTLGPDLTMGRLGWEEFTLLLPGLSADSARTLMQRLLAKVESTPFHLPTETSLLVTASVGLVTALTVGQGKLDELLKRADKALYQAQQDGGNRVHSETAVIPIATPALALPITETIPAALQQKRRNSRTDCKADLIVRIQGQNYPAQLCDIGVGGLRMNVNVKLLQEEVVEIRLRQNPETSVRAAVKWTKAPTVGLRFEDHAETLRSSWVSQLLKQLGRNADSARERRAHARLQVEHPLKVSAPEGTYTATASNIGLGGAGAESALAPPMGLVAQVEIAGIQVQARVRWVESRTFGLQFAPLSTAQRAILHRLVEGKSKPPGLASGFIPFD